MATNDTRRVLTLRHPPAPVRQDDDRQSEIAELRDRLANAKSQIAALERRVLHDGTLPVLRADAFINAVQVKRDVETGRRADRRRTQQGPGCLAEVTITNLTDVMTQFDDRASDAVMTHAARLLGGHVRAGDQVGRLGTASFGILLAYADPFGATSKMERLCMKIEETPVDWGGQSIPIKTKLRIARLGD